MTNTSAKLSVEKKKKFTPKLDNYKTSLQYEGLTLSTKDENRSITELKQKYAR
ncbi:hypothetical protein [Vibrio salinus]|uniref:hypothetical protein n=1 Tax=Vibrio salinus TaxID=2899784 RepID=UPI001E5454D3|nr:hypothetical protein [Vibrio salinus]MCE0492929.1 hypothetical protein [Vibrio salinus]